MERYEMFLKRLVCEFVIGYMFIGVIYGALFIYAMNYFRDMYGKPAMTDWWYEVLVLVNAATLFAAGVYLYRALKGKIECSPKVLRTLILTLLVFTIIIVGYDYTTIQASLHADTPIDDTAYNFSRFMLGGASMLNLNLITILYIFFKHIYKKRPQQSPTQANLNIKRF